MTEGLSSGPQEVALSPPPEDTAIFESMTALVEFLEEQRRALRARQQKDDATKTFALNEAHRKKVARAGQRGERSSWRRPASVASEFSKTGILPIRPPDPTHPQTEIDYKPGSAVPRLFGDEKPLLWASPAKQSGHGPGSSGKRIAPRKGQQTTTNGPPWMVPYGTPRLLSSTRYLADTPAAVCLPHSARAGATKHASNGRLVKG